jgi:hypothetical protein
LGNEAAATRIISSWPFENETIGGTTSASTRMMSLSIASTCAACTSPRLVAIAIVPLSLSIMTASLSLPVFNKRRHLAQRHAASEIGSGVAQQRDTDDRWRSRHSIG